MSLPKPQVKVKVKLPLCFNWAPRHEGVLGEWRYSSIHSLTSALDGGQWSVSRCGRFTPRERAPWYPLDRSLGGPQICSRRGDEKNSQPPPGIEPYNSHRPARSPALYLLSYHGSSLRSLRVSVKWLTDWLTHWLTNYVSIYLSISMDQSPWEADSHSPCPQFHYHVHKSPPLASWMHVWFVTFVPKCLKFAACSKDLLAISTSWFSLHFGDET
jgi:hypothetical protein